MAKLDSLGIYLPNGSTLDKLKETYATVVDRVMQGLSQRLKNTEISGDPQGGTVEVRRMLIAESNAYGTARAAEEGVSVKNSVVTLSVDTDKEIVEEVEKKDLRLHPIENIIEKRSPKHVQAMQRELDEAFFAEAENAGTEVTLESTELVDQIEEIVVELETLSNDYVDGVDRADIVLTVKPSVYSQLRNYIDTLANPNEGGVDAKFFHDVEILVNRRQDADIIAMGRGSVAQVVVADVYGVEKIELSNAFAASLFYSYGTKAVQPDLILYANLEEVSA